MLAEDLDLKSCLDAAHVLEATTLHLSQMRQPENERKVNRVYDSKDRNCYRCGHTGCISNATQCPTKNAKCRRCNKVGHFEKVCRTKQHGYKRKYDTSNDDSSNDSRKKRRFKSNRVFNVKEENQSKDGNKYGSESEQPNEEVIFVAKMIVK